MPRMNSGAAQDILQSFQQKMAETQESLATENVQVTVGGGAVLVVINGKQQIQSVKISADAMSAGDVEMLQDLIVAAMNEAIDKSQQLAATKMSSVTGGLGLGNLGGLLG
ncbi:MAG: YbaB/EbfC family nucleoid-associated protein [Chloroflexi bacterium]|nr:YbaB/EbfC family nucleoid-associated protein [Chloroflexota bacterium]